MTDPTTTPTPTEPHHNVRDERARDVAWNGWIDDHRDHGSVTRELMAAFDAGWAAAVSAAAPDERELVERAARTEAERRYPPSSTAERAGFVAGALWHRARGGDFRAALAARPAPVVNAADADVWEALFERVAAVVDVATHLGAAVDAVVAILGLMVADERRTEA